MAMVTPIAVASMKADTGPGRTDMRAGSNAAVAHTGARANRTDMGTRISAVTADTGAHPDNRTGMAARMYALTADAGPGANRADMGARAHAMAADMRPNTHAQHLYTPPHIRKGSGGNQ